MKRILLEPILRSLAHSPLAKHLHAGYPPHPSLTSRTPPFPTPLSLALEPDELPDRPRPSLTPTLPASFLEAANDRRRPPRPAALESPLPRPLSSSSPTATSSASKPTTTSSNSPASKPRSAATSTRCTPSSASARSWNQTTPPSPERPPHRPGLEPVPISLEASPWLKRLSTI